MKNVEDMSVDLGVYVSSDETAVIFTALMNVLWAMSAFVKEQNRDNLVILSQATAQAVAEVKEVFSIQDEHDADLISVPQFAVIHEVLVVAITLIIMAQKVNNIKIDYKNGVTNVG